MSDVAAFNDTARAAIYQLGEGRCIGCGSSKITAQHRRARGMGGSTDVSIGHPANGVPLCGSGTWGCHGWAEAHPVDAELLGWRLAPGTPALGAPLWHRLYGWRAWAQPDLANPTWVCHEYVCVDEDLDRAPERLKAIDRFHSWLHRTQEVHRPFHSL